MMKMNENSKKIICDLDNTITIENSGVSYANKEPNQEVIKKLLEYREMGYEIIIHTARNMKSFQSDLSKINIYTIPIITNWLDRNNVPYDGLIVGKPYCGAEGFYVDDRSIRPDEFLNYSKEEILKLLEK